MLVEADRTGCLREVLVIAAALSVQDPRERPVDQRQAADEKHARFAVDGSDFLSYLNLWRHVAERREALSGSRFRKELRAEFLHFLRIREWQDLHAQLRQAARNAGLTPNDADASPGQVHIAVLSGLLSQIGLREGETREYLGARGAHFMIFPGSPLAKKNPRWVMAAELVETSRLFARTVAKIQPEWIEPLAGHLVKRTYSEPHWSRKRAAAVAVERVTLHGVPIVVDRRVDYGRIDPETSRDLFIRHALVEGDWDTRHRFFHANRALLEDVEELETRARRRDLSVDEETLVAFYDARIPAHVVSGRHFDTWWRKQRDKSLLGLHRRDGPHRAGRRDRPVGLPGPRRGGRAHAAAVVRVRAGPQRRRDHGRRAGRGAAPGGPDAVHVAGARVAGRAGHGVDQDAAQDPAAPVRARARPRPRRARPAQRR